MKQNHKLSILLSVMLGVMLVPQMALAYVDPATTSYLLQAVAGVVITCGVVLGVFWKKIKLFFSNLKMKRLEKKITKQAEKQNKTA